MDLITLGAIALGFLGSKFADWSINKAFDVAYDKAMQTLAAKSPETAEAFALPPSEREDIGVALLVEQVEQAAQKDPEIKQAVEALGSQVTTAAQDHPELAKAIQELTATLKAQKPTTVENWRGINIKGGENTINNPTLNF
ncbi:MAG TPA: hypothetical protein IGS40_08360 [Trichormus sp. M33_DOE_039]|nr:hypothetical protein [Trichormus sp. M33_DOE_039]